MTERTNGGDQEDPTSPRNEVSREQNYLFQGAVLLGVIALTAIVTLWVSRDSTRSGVEIVIPPAQPVTFQVSGEVGRPGVYSLEGEPRVDDAIEAAGGFTDEANIDILNLALPVRDGSKLVVPSVSQVDSSGVKNSSNQSTPSADLSGTGEITTDPNGLIDLNTASKDQLIALPGIGEVRADSIIEWRTNNLISSVSDLLAISGIGPSTVDSIRDHVVQP